jgi:pyrimidine-nucleoside phosphorylase
MTPAELIETKRDGAELEPGDLCRFLEAYLRDEVADYQMSALLMAIFFRGLTAAETEEMTRAIIESGRRLDFAGAGPPAVDKHSTGGVGDKVSLVLAPLLAEFGLRVPMMSGRGLGHTGGTLDKLESIPGFRTGLDLDEFRRVVDEVGCAMIGQTPEIAPLDGRLYALRDVSGSVQSLPLIAASIVSKKVAEGISGLVLDVKVGRGAFMRDEAAARELAETMVALARSFGLKASALLTAMDEPLGVAVGNALEVREAIDCLRGGGPADLREVTLELCAVAAVDSGVAPDVGAARSRLASLLDDGTALERFGRLVERQGGDRRVIEDAGRLAAAPVVREFTAPRSGRVAALDAREVGLAAVELGAGRRALGDEIDPAVGFEVLCAVGDEVEAGRLLARVHARTDEDAARAAARLEQALELTDVPLDATPLILGRIAPAGAPDAEKVAEPG